MQTYKVKYGHFGSAREKDIEADRVVEEGLFVFFYDEGGSMVAMVPTRLIELVVMLK